MALIEKRSSPLCDTGHEEILVAFPRMPIGKMSRQIELNIQDTSNDTVGNNFACAHERRPPPPSITHEQTFPSISSLCHEGLKCTRLSKVCGHRLFEKYGEPVRKHLYRLSDMESGW